MDLWRLLAVGRPLQHNAHFVVRWEDCAFSSSEIMVLERGGDELNEAESLIDLRNDICCHSELIRLLLVDLLVCLVYGN